MLGLLFPGSAKADFG